MFKTKTPVSFLFALLISVASTAPAATCYIQSDLSGEFPTIQAAIRAAAPGDSIILAAGTFTGPGNTNVDFEGKAITVCSQFGPEVTIIDCEATAGGFIFRSEEDSTSVLAGVTILNGRANFYGGAVYCKSASPTITGNIFQANQSGFQGGGVYCDRSNAVVRGNMFFENSASQGGGLWCSGGSTILVNSNRFVGNVASEHGGALACDDSSPVIRDNTFIGNVALELGGGVAVTSEGDAAILGNVFEENGLVGDQIYSAAGGAIGCRQSLPSTVIVGNVIMGNGANCGGGVCFESNSLGILANNTFDENRGNLGAGIYCTDFSDPQIKFNIIVNSALGLPIDTGNFAGPQVGCCDLFGNEYGDTLPPGVDDKGGNVNLDPQFCGGEGTGNYYLLSSSPCLPGNTFAECDTLIGARGIGCSVIVGVGDVKPRQKHRLMKNYPNPFNIATTIGFEIVSKPEPITIAIFDVGGRSIRTLLHGVVPVGPGAVIWDGRDDYGRYVSSGVYFCCLSAAGQETARKMVLLK